MLDEWVYTTDARIKCDSCGEWIYTRRHVTGTMLAFPHACQACGTPLPIEDSRACRICGKGICGLRAGLHADWCPSR